MITVAIVPQPFSDDHAYRAFAGRHQSTGRTPGEALDTLAGQLTDQDAGEFIIVRQLRPDAFFTEAQQKRLAELMQRWRAARDAKLSLSPMDEQELTALVDEELEASRKRAACLESHLEP